MTARAPDPRAAQFCPSGLGAALLPACYAVQPIANCCGAAAAKVWAVQGEMGSPPGMGLRVR